MEKLNIAGHAVIAEKNYLDANCKQIFGSKSMAAFVVKHTVSEFKDMTLDEIMEHISGEPEVMSRNVDDIPKANGETPEMINCMNSESKSPNDGEINYDVIFGMMLPDSDDKIRLIVDIEAQNNFFPDYHITSRATYYVAREVSAQKGRQFEDSEYDNIKKVYSIWICISPDKEARGILNVYEMQEKCLVGNYHFPKNTYDKFCMVIVGLGDKNSPNELISMLSKVYDPKITAKEKIQAVKDCGVQVTTEIKGGIEDMYKYSDYVYDTGYAEGEAKGILKGKAEGKAEGRAEGKSEGILVGYVNCMRSLMEGRKLSFDDAANELSISVVDRPALRKAMEQ